MEPDPAVVIDYLIGEIADARSRRRIIDAWRAGDITEEKTAHLLRECGFEGEQ